MRLYKYRSLDPIEHSLDILLNERLYCAPYQDLNDPFEGLFLSVRHHHVGIGNLGLGGVAIAGSRKTRTIASIAELPIKGKSRICSFSATLGDVRLWSHYARGHMGIAIEIELDESEELHKVNYKDSLEEFGTTLLTSPSSSEILRIKTKHWAYEEEYRYITDSETIFIAGRIKGVYLGIRVSELMRKLLLRSLPINIPVFATRLDEAQVLIAQGESISRE